MILKIAIVDDDIQLRSQLSASLTELLGDTAQLVCFSSGEEFLQVWRTRDFDLVILDIFMDKLTGMEVARTIRRTDTAMKIVFSTTSNEYASESYEVNACYYLHKPYGKDQVQTMLDRINLVKLEQMRTIRLPDGTCVALHSILYADCAAHCTRLHLKGGEIISVRANLSEIESLLCAYPYFFSPTKGVVINFYAVTGQGKDTFQMQDGGLIPISRRKAKEVLDAYSSFLFQQLRKEEY